MNAMDIGFISQTLDSLGSFRLTTKLPEYLACGLPVAMSPVPGFYDYATAAGWALPAHHPGSQKFHKQCAEWLDQLTWVDVASKAAEARNIACQRFDYTHLAQRFSVFIDALLGLADLTSSMSTERDLSQLQDKKERRMVKSDQ
jgi:hypothetical protein